MYWCNVYILIKIFAAKVFAHSFRRSNSRTVGQLIVCYLEQMVSAIFFNENYLEIVNKLYTHTQYETITIRDITHFSLAIILLFQCRCCYVVNKCCDVNILDLL